MRNTKREQMGEVHVKVRLSNATDTELSEQGVLKADQVRSCDVDALVDTGASRSVISETVAEQLGLRIRRQATATLADGSRVPAGVSSAIRFEIEGRETLEDAYVLRSEERRVGKECRL